MGESARNSKRTAETEFLESSITSPSKKMKFDFEEFNLPSLNLKLQTHRCSYASPEKFISPATSSNSSGFQTGDSSCGASPVSCCSSNELHKNVKDSIDFLDLEAKSLETENSTCINYKFSRETTPSSKSRSHSGDHMDSQSAERDKANSSPRKSPAAKMPTQGEIDEFFAVAEKEDQRRFAERYNYDVVKDLPMEGRYQWIRLKP